jgi:hypothetical protein
LTFSVTLPEWRIANGATFSIISPNGYEVGTLALDPEGEEYLAYDSWHLEEYVSTGRHATGSAEQNPAGWSANYWMVRDNVRGDSTYLTGW